jgi:hypothetical protein
MLETKGGWDIRPLPKLSYVERTPWRWTQLLLDNAYKSTVDIADRVVASLQFPESSALDTSLLNSENVERLISDVQLQLSPLVHTVQDHLIQPVERYVESAMQQAKSNEMMQEVQKDAAQVFGQAEEFWRQFDAAML